MDKFPICWNGTVQGELITEKEPLYHCFHAHCRLPEKGLWCVWAVGDQGELRLGILEPCGNGAVIRRRFSDRMTQPLGKLLRAEIRPVEVDREKDWQPMKIIPFQTPWLRQRLRDYSDVLVRTAGRRYFLAIPYAADKPFPLVPLFCFVNMRRIGSREYVVLALNEEELPILP